jgi:hypothetical protein
MKIRFHDPFTLSEVEMRTTSTSFAARPSTSLRTNGALGQSL